MTTASHDTMPPLKGNTDDCVASNTYPKSHEAICGGDTSPRMEKMIFDCDEDLMSVLTKTRSLPPHISQNIFYAMINGEALEDAPSTTTATDDDNIMSPTPLSPLLLGDDATQEEAMMMMTALSTHSSSIGSVCSSNKRSSTKKRINKSKKLHDPPAVITIDELGSENDEYIEPLKSPGAKGRNRRPKKSSSVFYQLANEVRTKFELQEKAQRFKECVDVRDRTKNLVVYKQCFIGSEAVDAMLYTELADTREEAVELGRRLSRDLNLFKHVRGRHLFKDDDLFYQYNSKAKWDSGSSTSASSCDNSTLKQIGFSSGGSTCHSCDNSVQSALTNSERRQALLDRERLENMAKAFRGCVEVKDRRFRLKTYKQCFVGSEAVDILVSTRLVATRKDAVEFGRTLMREMNLFQHVTGDHAFSDEHLFFRFAEDGPANNRILPMPLATL